MKSLKLFSVAAPFATYAVYWFHTKSETPALKPSLLHAAEKQLKLEQIQVVFRHGARTPLSFWTRKQFEGFPNIEAKTWDQDELLKQLPWTDIDYVVKLEDGSDPTDVQFDGYHGVERTLKGGCFNGQLTNVGQQQLYELGKSLAQQYIVDQQFISPTYAKNQDLYVRSTYYRRTIMSTIGLVSGLYGKENITEPVHIETKRISKEDLFANWSACSNFVKWFMSCKHVYTEEEKEVEAEINVLLGRKEDVRPAFLIAVNDLMHMRELHGFHIPQYLLDKKEMIRKLSIEKMMLLLGKESTAITRHGIGSFLETLCSRMNEAIEQPRTTKMMLYAAHDWTLFSIFIALGVDVNEWPDPASYFIFELHKCEQDDNRYVRVVYNGEPLMLDGETEYLPVEKFMDLLKDYRVADFDEDCGNVL